MTQSDTILNFWFGTADHPEYGSKREFWFNSGSQSGESVDEDIRRRFGRDYERAVDGAYDGWGEERMPCLALILLCDQFPRNMFRGEAQAYATDGRALALARLAAARGDRDHLLPVQQLFLALPFEHSEDIADQHQCLALFEAMPEGEIRDGAVKSAINHMEIIERFGRFPHRNGILGRESTAEELEFLSENGDQHFGARKWSER